MEIGVYSFAEMGPDPLTGSTISAGQRIRDLLEEIKLADEVGLDVFGVGEHHRPDFAVSSPSTILAAAAALSKRIHLTSAATVLATEEPARIFEQFSTIDLISDRRAEIMVGRGAYVESFRLFRRELNGYERMFTSNLNSLIAIRKGHIRGWAEGEQGAEPTSLEVYPRPEREIPIWYASNGSPQSAVQAGKLGLPVALKVNSGQSQNYLSFVERYRQAGLSLGKGGFNPQIGINCHGFVGHDEAKATEDFFPYYASAMNKNRRGRELEEFTLSEFDYDARPENSLVFGTPSQVIDKILYQHALFGHHRFLMQMSAGNVPHNSIMKSIELLGTVVAPAVRAALSGRSEFAAESRLAPAV